MKGKPVAEGLLKRGLQLAGLIILCQGVGIAGALVTAGSVDSWYAEIQKPFFNPPNWIFGPMWTLLYLMMAVSCWLILQSGTEKHLRRTAVFLFGLQLFVNGLWSPVFFGLKNPGLAFAHILILWAAIALTYRAFLRVSRPAGLLLLPYWVWVSFAALLNFEIWRLNS